MKDLKPFEEYNIGNTPIYKANAYCPSGNLFVKLEMQNPNGGIKIRSAHYIIKDLIKSKRLNPNSKLVESSSGNLGLAIGYFARELGIQFRCLVDPTVPMEKVEQLKDAGIDVSVVSAEENSDYRTARINMAQQLDQQTDWIWTNQYDNPANFRAHYETTGPEIWAQMNGDINYVVCPVGTGGTICGIGHFLKKKNPEIKIVGVEPEGSTTFGGKPGKYLSVGAGMLEPSGIFKKYGRIVDYYCKIKDQDALQECVNFHTLENKSIGVTSGSALVAASYLAVTHPDENIIIIAADSGIQYVNLFKDIKPARPGTYDIVLHNHCK